MLQHSLNVDICHIDGLLPTQAKHITDFMVHSTPLCPSDSESCLKQEVLQSFLVVVFCWNTKVQSP